MAIFLPSPSLPCSQKEVQLYLKIFTVKDHFKPSSDLQASSWIDNAEQDRPFLSHAASAAVELSLVRREASQQLFSLEEASPSTACALLPCCSGSDWSPITFGPLPSYLTLPYNKLHKPLLCL